MCRDHHQHSELFQDINWNHDEKYHPCPRWFVLSSTTLLPSLQHKLVHVLCCTLSSSISNWCYDSTAEYYHPWCQECCEDCSTSSEFLLLWYFSPSPFFLGPRVDSNRCTNKWMVLFEFCPSSNPIALKLMVDISFLGHWLSNHHSDIDRTT